MSKTMQEKQKELLAKADFAFEMELKRIGKKEASEEYKLLFVSGFLSGFTEAMITMQQEEEEIIKNLKKYKK